MRKLFIVAIFIVSAHNCFAELTQEQKVTDFLTMAGLYNRGYAPYEWKKQVFGYDLADIDPWLAKVKASKSDLEFYDICLHYVASLKDSHASFLLPVLYEAYLPLTADIYDGKVLIDGIDPSALDLQKYPINFGDEVVSIDGMSAADWIEAYKPYARGGYGNPVSVERIGAAAIFDRYQAFYPFANRTQAGDVATLVIRSGNALGTYKIPWLTVGIPLTEEGSVPNPSHGAVKFTSRGQLKKSLREEVQASANSWGQWTGPSAPRKSSSDDKGPLKKLQDLSMDRPQIPVAGSILPFSSPFPKCNPPTGFQLRLGASQTDEFLSGYFVAGSRYIGFIRIRNFDPADMARAVQQFQTEMAFFQDYMSGLVIDVMGNGGG